MMKKIFAAALTVGALVGLAPSAQAAPLPDCLNIGLTHRAGNDIVGYGSSSCPGSGKIVIQWSRWFGWEDVKSDFLPNHGRDVYLRWNCANSGTHDFRTVVYDYGGRSKTSNKITASC